MSAVRTRESRLARAERLAQGPIKVKWERVIVLGITLATLAGGLWVFYTMSAMVVDAL